MADDRIIEIETRLAHHEKQIADLSEIAAAQWKEIESLRRQLGEALSRIEEAEGGAPPASVKPPHY